ncbi:alkaline phosphatase family protein [Paraflavitalea soli]|uniref:Alkaline phosphatase family protein n=1 Tax=Paraflavitalea soli TaxID=2315862 RepID=A0A3B7MY30_9BACT|nr:alkaline phosphatase family protein [Paraflavitalea soli]AXY77966.1 alkaline phosphatase family protein [Paraflavitalea soli]
MYNKIFRNRFSFIWVIIGLYVILSTITRIALLLATTSAGITIGQFSGLFSIGFLYDLAIASFLIIPFVLHLWLQNNLIYQKKMLPWVSLFFIGLLSLLLFTNIVPKDFSPQLHTAIIAYIAFRFAIYLLLFFVPNFRTRWRTGVLYFGLGLVTFLLLLNAVSEWFFWQEFSSRYNFIAVDYLVYTTEVLGNINESYPIAWIMTALIITAIAIVFMSRSLVRTCVNQSLTFGKRSLLAICLLILPVIAYLAVPEKWRHFSRNEYANSLAGNGIYEFAIAYTQNELDFYQFYKTLPDESAFKLLKQQLQLPNTRFVSDDPFNIEREVVYAEPERKLNVVLISVESLSADFMKAFGNTNTITPYLDSLAAHTLFFTNLYASGTRTVRGLEALSLSIPPTPGQSIVKRPDNGGLFSLGSVLRSKGYITQYIYGGYSYFDNMKTFFGNNGYTVIDRSAIKPQDVHYQNIWGVADEDLFSLALHTLDSNDATHKPFFSQIMTVSNHRPYTYPDGRIDIPPSTQSREGAVKYTDYAINKFLKEASTRKWFDSTVFVIVADHCAGSAGSVELPVTGYHIPMLIYAPKILQPRAVDALTAQIDVAPTILGMLRFQYRSKFFGQDVLNTPAEKQRAFISTYQGLGYLRNGRLVLQSPVKTVRQFKPDFATGNASTVNLDDSLVNQAIAYYQCASWLLKNKKQSE